MGLYCVPMLLEQRDANRKYVLEIKEIAKALKDSDLLDCRSLRRKESIKFILKHLSKWMVVCTATFLQNILYKTLITRFTLRNKDYH